jgi:hypothetical protein
MTLTFRENPLTDGKNRFSPNHFMEQELAAYRFLIIMMYSLPLKNENKHKEKKTPLLIAKTNGIPYSIISKLNTQITQEISLTPSYNSTLSNPEKWVTFTYYNPMIRKITNFFKSTNIQITFRTNNTIHDIRKTLTNNTNTYMHSDIIN